MSSTKNELKRYVGYKFFREEDDNTKFELLRIIGLKEFNDKIIVQNEETGSTFTLTYQTLKKDYIPLEPMGFITINAVWMGTDITSRSKDVVVMVHDMFRYTKLNDRIPSIICRQSINDFFYDTIRSDLDQEVVGVCVTRESCPANIQFPQLLGCNGVIETHFVNYYRDDTLDSIMECVDTNFFDPIMEENFMAHMKNFGLETFVSDKMRHHNGWCRTLKTLLHENAFITDFDEIRGIQALDFNLADHIIISERDAPGHLDDIVRVFMSKTYRIMIKDTFVIPFDYDIDMAKFNNESYIFFRDIMDTTYLVVYTLAGEFLEDELEKEAEKLSISDEIRIAFYNKYRGYKGETIKDLN